MSATAVKLWLLAYDVACPKRLGRVYRRVRREGLRLQYSMYATRARDKGIKALLADVDNLIEHEEDDVRAYHVPATCKVWTMGREALPEGVMLDSEEVVRLLRSTTASDEFDEPGDGNDVFLLS